MANRKLKFAANISTMFAEFPFEERFAAAKAAGFQAVECQFPYAISNDSLKKLKLESGVERVVLMNSYPGEKVMGEMGLACIPGLEIDFLTGMQKSIEYAQSVNCNKLHIMGGIMKKGSFALDDYYMIYENNLVNGVEMLSEQNMIGLIEPICKSVVKSYILSSFEKALEIIQKVNSPNLKLLLDIYHLRMLTTDDLLDSIRTYYPYAGHIQVSQAPTRHEPNYPGDIDYRAVFNLLEELGHADYIGLEYTPSVGETKDSLNWLHEFGYEL